MNKKTVSTFGKFMQDETQKGLFQEEYSRFLLSEFLIDAMEEQQLSVRGLSEKSGVSTSIIQNIRSDKEVNITLKTLLALTACLGYQINFTRITPEQ